MEARLDLADQSATEALARHVARRARPGDLVALSGGLGAGKSVFARAFLRALSGDPVLDVPSPSFSLVQLYDTPLGQVAHLDLWRLDGPEALAELGWDEFRAGLMLVEWPERAGAEIPPDALRITLLPGAGDDARVAELSGWPDRS
ncbi:tRNA (adenosine(37)-N6)-threonylcarbamoyltransferase complex ATPase subunit type 1 TsaE [Acidomonas methanolica]|uniref:tRNA (adenosine(37)-N6)-threonylcarbamoyltransferase complex ATPase subunit type 1 TsaE n=1 Tax=Acidomonas methanolica TaxID=437 RepID=UPI00211A8866|nr:tRNA (adenosine(37)-N6)-threonylcarbamoyltransferase complex ATPase subunit type 1 TsaE [Acidomonas methanolica]MCQ9155100.1 tRNA (adenosine(37)-N6)-threonylcarbamoyltransferase complex ATPase subunit type 1 TsaE [Acidomonas methanolica]